MRYEKERTSVSRGVAVEGLEKPLSELRVEKCMWVRKE
jgi:hypothetical protein